MKAIAAAIPIAETIAAAEPVPAAEAVATAKTVATPEPAAVALRTRMRMLLRLGRAGVDAMNGDDLQTPRRLLKIANHRRSRRHIGRADRSQRRSVAERIATVLEGDEAVSLRRVEPLDRPFGRSHRQRLRAFVFEICHETSIRPYRITKD